MVNSAKFCNCDLSPEEFRAGLFKFMQRHLLMISYVSIELDIVDSLQDLQEIMLYLD